MDYKLEYMERLFAKIGKKKTESYVISRIWHQLDDDRVKFFNTKLRQKSGIRKNEVIELIYRGFI